MTIDNAIIKESGLTVQPRHCLLKKAQRAYLDKDHMCPALSLFEISSINLVTLANRWLYDLKNITPRLMWLNLILMMKF